MTGVPPRLCQPPAWRARRRPWGRVPPPGCRARRRGGGGVPKWNPAAAHFPWALLAGNRWGGRADTPQTTTHLCTCGGERPPQAPDPAPPPRGGSTLHTSGPARANWEPQGRDGCQTRPPTASRCRGHAAWRPLVGRARDAPRPLRLGRRGPGATPVAVPNRGPDRRGHPAHRRWPWGGSRRGRRRQAGRPHSVGAPPRGAPVQGAATTAGPTEFWRGPRVAVTGVSQCKDTSLARDSTIM